MSYANRIQEMEWQDKGGIHSIVSRFPFCRRNSANIASISKARLFPGFLFVEETADVASFVASQNVALLVDAEGKRLSVCAEKAELAAEFAHLLK